jgi:hypothetical protein
LDLRHGRRPLPGASARWESGGALASRFGRVAVVLFGEPARMAIGDPALGAVGCRRRTPSRVRTQSVFRCRHHLLRDRDDMFPPSPDDLEMHAATQADVDSSRCSCALRWGPPSVDPIRELSAVAASRRSSTRRRGVRPPGDRRRQGRGLVKHEPRSASNGFYDDAFDYIYKDIEKPKQTYIMKRNEFF